MHPQPIKTKRLVLFPFTLEIANTIMEGRLDDLAAMDYRFGLGWPDQDALETVPKIIRNLERAGRPTGFESWLIVKQDGNAIIGDAGFKGEPDADGHIDIGYGIIESERKKGYANESARGLAAWAFAQPGIKVITATSLITNGDSANILRKMNFKETSRDDEMIHWSLTKKEAEIAIRS